MQVLKQSHNAIHLQSLLLIFTTNFFSNASKKDVLDLHGLFVKEALEVLEETLSSTSKSESHVTHVFDMVDLFDHNRDHMCGHWEGKPQQWWCG